MTVGVARAQTARGEDVAVHDMPKKKTKQASVRKSRHGAQSGRASVSLLRVPLLAQALLECLLVHHGAVRVSERIKRLVTAVAVARIGLPGDSLAVGASLGLGELRLSDDALNGDDSVLPVLAVFACRPGETAETGQPRRAGRPGRTRRTGCAALGFQVTDLHLLGDERRRLDSQDDDEDAAGYEMTPRSSRRFSFAVHMPPSAWTAAV